MYRGTSGVHSELAWNMKKLLQTLRCNYENNQQVILYRLIYYSKSPLHISGDVFAHHQEHLTVFTVPGSVHPSWCRLVSRMIWNCKSALHVSGDVFAHHQGHLTLFTVPGSVHPSCCRPSRQYKLDVYESVHRDTTMKITNKMHYID
jgi:hypothetical protein